MEKGAGVVSVLIINPVHEEITIKILFSIRDRMLPGYRWINETMLKDVTRHLSSPALRVFKKYFLANGRRQRWTPAYLFGLRFMREVELTVHYGNLDCRQTRWLQNKVVIQNIALGSFQHVIQDSFR